MKKPSGKANGAALPFHLVGLWTVAMTLFVVTANRSAVGHRRVHVVELTEFGAVGDGVTSNTKAFREAISHLSRLASSGGSMLVVPSGRWLTGPFNLTSHFTLFLQRRAVIVASTDMEEYPIVAPLPSYGRGRDMPGGRYSNFIWGSNLTDVIITGENGTIDGQGEFWWDKFRNNELKATRGHLLELMFSKNIVVSNLTFLNSPFWNLHPVYCKNVVITHVTVVSPVDSPNTDGINPDSSSHVLIEDCSVVSGDDCVAIKSGWDEYGIRFGIPSAHITIRRLSCVSPDSAAVAIGSEMSGGIRHVLAEDVSAFDTESAIRIKTGVGRGGFVRHIRVRRVRLRNVRYVFWITGNYGSHPDGGWDPRALPKVSGIRYSDVFAENVTGLVGRMEGIENDVFVNICLENVTALPNNVVDSSSPWWKCINVEGKAYRVSPRPCAGLVETAKPCSLLGPPARPLAHW